MKDKWTRVEYRKSRTRRRLRDPGSGRPRLTVFRSLKFIYAQVIDDAAGRTLASATSAAKEFAGQKAGKNIESAKLVGQLIARKAIAAGVKKVVFDRGACSYPGRVKALAESARAGGLEF